MYIDSGKNVKTLVQNQGKNSGTEILSSWYPFLREAGFELEKAEKNTCIAELEGALRGRGA